MRDKKDLEERPEIKSITNHSELRRWYWRKSELIAHARELGLKTNSGKFIILERIAHFLETGDKIYPGDRTAKPSSTFDWHKEPLSMATVITDSYKNTQNVRRFFRETVDEKFKFNIAFMEWMKSNVGRNLGDACEAYLEIQRNEKKPGYKTRIKSHNQFNQYTRDFLEDNPHLNMDDVRRVWALKIQQPSETGRHVYDRSDLKL